MKKLLLSILLLTPFITSAENYFTEGTTWLMKIVACADPENPIHYQTITLGEKTEMLDTDCYAMYSSTDNGTIVLRTYIRTEGDKVYFLQNDKATDWSLLYDFGLSVGEGCTINIIPYYWGSDDVISSYVKCIGRTTLEKYDNHAALILEEYSDKSSDICLGKGYWIDGIGCTNGVDTNCYFEADGNSSTLLSVSNGSNTICKNNTAGLQSISNDSATTINGKDITITGTTAAALYTCDGRLVASKRITTTGTISAPNPGIYILRTDNKFQKIVVR